LPIQVAEAGELAGVFGRGRGLRFAARAEIAAAEKI
jgi:hypothetical protein